MCVVCARMLIYEALVCYRLIWMKSRTAFYSDETI